MLKFVIKSFSLLPLKILYVFSDYLIYPTIYHIVRYRRKVVHKNLTNSFPDKSAKEIKALGKLYYHHIADLIAEIIWSYRATDEDMREHYNILNIEDIEEWAKQKDGLFLMAGHIGNWEWMPELQKRFKSDKIQQYNVYRRQKNKTVDEILVGLREKLSGKDTCIEKSETVRKLIQFKQAGICYTLGLVSDQKPQPKRTYYWTQFLNQDTGFLGGGEVLGKKFDKAICYIHINKVARGYYQTYYELITLNPQATDEGWITEQYARLLEKNILEQPHIWLWSHNRWKWKREDK